MLPAPYDVVGRYEQDQVNGLSDALLQVMIGHVAPRNAADVLDAMGGNGNLAERLAKHCVARRLSVPALTLLEYSRVQCELAATRLAPYGARVVWGDALTMASRDGGAPIAPGSFDRVMIKSANHEIPRLRHGDLQSSTFRVLRPGGWLVNLGFLFDDAGERDELAQIARVKDELAGMGEAVANRHFLTRDELYGDLAHAGFSDVGALSSFQYEIRSEVVAEQYFPAARRVDNDRVHQAAQRRAVHLRRSGRVTFEGDSSVMRPPGEITLARRPTAIEARDRGRVRHPLEGLRHEGGHARLLHAIIAALPPVGKIVELGCGVGLLPERLFAGAAHAYLGLDTDTAAIALATMRFAGEPGRTFEVGSVERIPAHMNAAVVWPTALHDPLVDPVLCLNAVVERLAPGGTLLAVAASPSDRARQAGQCWSAEGLAARLRDLGLVVDSTVPAMPGGTAHLVVGSARSGR